MKRILLCLMVALFATGCLFAKNNDEKMNVMSYNIRYDNSGDKDNQWKFRRDFAADLVKFHEADVFGAQEVLNNQLNDLLDRLPEYAYVGVGREDGKTKGEYAPIFYRKDRFSVEKSGNFWLAEDINAVGKKGWDAACERVATWAILKDKNTGKKFFFLNTHLDHMYNPQIQISAESETKRSIFRKRDKTKRSKKESAQHSKSRNKSFVMTSVSAL